MEGAFIGQDPFEARHALFVGEAAKRFHLNRFSVVHRERLPLHYGTVEVAIIGESHYMVVHDRSGTAVCAELLACVQVDGLAVAPTCCHAVCEKPAERLEARSDRMRISATARVSRGPWTEGCPLPSAPPGGIALTHVFSGPCAPRTHVVLWVDEAGHVRMETIHEYVSADRRIVPILSETSFTMEEESR